MDLEYWARGNLPTYGGYKCSHCGYQTVQYALSRCPSCKSLMHTKFVGYVSKPRWYRKRKEVNENAV